MAVTSEDVRYDEECPHYKRGCSFVSPCCKKIYKCRLCHDEVEEFSHKIDRFAVKEIICRRCSTKQLVGNKCRKCDLIFGTYYCPVCHFYDNNDKQQFHCDKCGICRIGGKQNFYHCDKCGFCLSNEMKETHVCRQDSSKDNCPLCMEDIHTSRDPAHVPKCGHLLHMLYRCPQCQTSLTDMTHAWNDMDREIGVWEMPQHLRDFKVKVKCRDCNKETETVYHIIGLKCTDCNSYNTVRSGSEEIPEDAVPVRIQEFMEQQGRNRNNNGQEDEEEEEVDDENNEQEDASDHEH